MSTRDALTDKLAECAAEGMGAREIAQALMDRFVIVERGRENVRFVHTLVDHAFKAAKTSVENSRGDEVYSADHLKHAISLLASAVEVLERPEADQ